MGRSGPMAYPAQRRLARIRDEATGETVWGWRPLGGWDAFEADPDPGCNCGLQPPPPDPGKAGCADFELEDPDTTLSLQWTRWAVWGDPMDPSAPATGNQVIGYNCDDTMTVCEFEIPLVAGIAVDPGGTTNVVISNNHERVDPVDWAVWAITFAEDRFAALGEQPLENTRVYVGYDAANVLPGVTQADRTFGNQPSVVLGGNSYHSKFLAAHEYGHVQTMIAHQPSFEPANVEYCYDPATYPAPPNSCDWDHTLSSSEWQSAAAIEGFAHWYSASTWHDVDDEECGACMNRTGYVQVTDSSTAISHAIPRGSPVCPESVGPPCPAGVSNEHDWVSALRTFRLDAATTPDFRTMLTMLEAYYDAGNWVVAEATDAFWTGFDQAMAGHLGSSYSDWESAAQTWRLGR